MKKLAKVFCLILSLTMILSATVGCSGDKLKTFDLPHFDYSEGDGSEVNTELFFKNLDTKIAIKDPTTLYVDGWFYTSGTRGGNDYRMWKSRDLTNWEEVGIIFSSTDLFFGVRDFWAPQLFYDPDADWSYYLGEGGGEGKGLYCIFFSARVGQDRLNSLGQATNQMSVAFSKEVTGPYEFFRGTNANGEYFDESKYLFDIEKIKDIDFSEWENANEAFGPIYKEGRSFIDACPFIDPATGDKYLYFVCNRYAGDKSNDIWGVKMKDWVSPDYPTVRPLTVEGYTTTDQKEELEDRQKSFARIDEGPFMHYQDFTDDGVHNGTYYLTFSILTYGYQFYAPMQALADDPLGRFEKIQVSDHGYVMSPELDWDVYALGHHDFFYVGDEIWTTYHTAKFVDGVGGQESGYGYLLAVDRIKFIDRGDGVMVMRANGPTRTVQPLPVEVSGYRNIAEDATVTVSDGDGALLNDGYLAIDEDRIVEEFITEKSSLEIKLDWEDFVRARSVMVYNSYEWSRLFDNVESIEFSIRQKIDGKYYYGTARIEDLGYDIEKNRVDRRFFMLTDEQIASGNYDAEYDVIGPCTAAVAEFDEIEFNSVTIKVKKAKGKDGIGIQEIVVLGKAE